MKEDLTSTINRDVTATYEKKLKQAGNSIHTVLDAQAPITNYLYDYYSKYYIKKHSRFKKGDRVLDFGCGLGRLSGHFAKHVNQITAVDISKDLIEVAKASNVNSNVNYLFINSLSELEEGDYQFDVIYVFGVFLHINDAEMHLILKDFTRLAKEGVRVVIIEPTLKNSKKVSDSLFYRTSDEIINIFEANDFKMRYTQSVIRKPSYSFHLMKKMNLKSSWLLPIYRIVEEATIHRKPIHVEGFWQLFVFCK